MWTKAVELQGAKVKDLGVWGPMGLGCRVQGLGLRSWGLGFRARWLHSFRERGGKPHRADLQDLR